VKVAATVRFSSLTLSLCGTLWFAEFAHGAVLWGILDRIPAFTALGLEEALKRVGWARSLYVLCELLCKLPAGRLVDRVGSGRPLVLGILLSMVSAALIYVAGYLWQSPALVVLGCAIHGVGAAPLWPAVIAALMNRTPESRRGQIMGSILAAWMAGLGAGLLVLTTLLYRNEEQGSTIGWLLIAGAWTSALVGGTWSSRDLGFVPGSRVAPLSPTLPERRSARLLGLAGGLLVQTLALGMLAHVFRVYVERTITWSPIPNLSPATLLLVAGGLPVALCLAPLGRVADQIGKRRSVVLGLGTSAPLLVVVGTLPQLPPALRFLVAVPTVAILGMAYALLLPAWHALVMTQVGDEQRGQVFSLFMTVEGLALAMGTSASGLLAARLGLAAPFYVSGVVLSLLAVIYAGTHVLPPDSTSSPPS